MRGERLRVALIGCGAMGSRHARVLQRDPSCEWLAIDIAPERACALAERHGGRSSRAIPQEIDAAIVATPTSTHVQVGLPLLERGLYCLVEKPLAETLSGARQLQGPRCRVGHVERFNPALRAAGALRPRLVEARRLSPPTGRGLDVDVVMDLMIHDLDLLLRWAGEDGPWEVLEASGSRDPGQRDTASAGRRGAQREPMNTVSATLQSSSGLQAKLLASRAAEQRERTIRCVEPGQDTLLDLLAGVAHRQGQQLQDADPRDALTLQWEAFSAAARGEGGGPVASEAVASGVRAVELAQQIRDFLEGAVPCAP